MADTAAKLDAAKDAAKNDIDALQADLKRLRDDVVALTQTIAALTAQRASRGLGAAQDVGERVVESVYKTAEGMKKAGNASLVTLEEKIIERPVTSILMALGIGLLLGKLTERR